MVVVVEGVMIRFVNRPRSINIERKLKMFTPGNYSVMANGTGVVQAAVVK